MPKAVYVSISDTLLMSAPRNNEYDLWERGHEGPQMTDEREHGAREVLERLARIATAYAPIEGSSSMEMAAVMVSYLAAHLDLVPDFMRGMESPNGWPPDWRIGGNLTWLGSDERYHDPVKDISSLESGSISERVSIVRSLRVQASDHRRHSDNARHGLAIRLEHERCAAIIEKIADEINRGMHRQSPGRTIA